MSRGGGRERGRQRIWSRLCVVSAKTDMGLELMNQEIMAKVGHSTDWASQVPRRFTFLYSASKFWSYHANTFLRKLSPHSFHCLHLYIKNSSLHLQPIPRLWAPEVCMQLVFWHPSWVSQGRLTRDWSNTRPAPRPPAIPRKCGLLSVTSFGA